MNILAHGIARQPTSAAMLVSGADIFTNAGVRQSTPTSATIVNTPPTFAGIAGVTPNVNGSLAVSWLAASSTKNPVKYAVYCALGSVTAAALFGGPNLVSYAPDTALGSSIWTLGDQTTFLVRGLTYTVGVKAVDAIGIVDLNMVILTSVATGSGNLPQVLQQVAIDLAATEALLAADHVDLAATALDLAGTASDMAATEVLLAADVVQFDMDLVTLGDDLATLGADLVTLGITDASLASSAGDLATSVSELEVVVGDLQSKLAGVDPNAITAIIESNDLEGFGE